VASSPSLVARVARSAALGASAAALLAAVGTSILGAFLLQEAEDRRLREAGLVLAMELARVPARAERIEPIVRQEQEETKHAGIRFAVREETRRYLAGDPDIDQPLANECVMRANVHLRICSVAAPGRLLVSTASNHTPQTPLFVVAAAVAVAFAGVVTWLWSRPVARAAVAPVSRLGLRVAAIDVNAVQCADLGPSEGVLEVDDLRATIAQLIERLARALAQAQRFAANAAHELRTPLTAVGAELELLAEQPTLTETVASGVATAQLKLTELGVLIDKLLVLATPRGTRDEPAEIVSLRDVMEDVLRGFSPPRAKKVHLAEADATVRGDSVLLSSMFANAVANALEFGTEVRVNLTTIDGNVLITIDDDGAGLAEHDRERVFEPFYRGRDALHRRIPGHGLGLALIRHVAERHGGDAYFLDKATPGASLRIELPNLPS
jgi:two-component system, OmpR family, sensor kinase